MSRHFLSVKFEWKPRREQFGYTFEQGKINHITVLSNVLAIISAFDDAKLFTSPRQFVSFLT